VTIINALPFNFTNGTTADATQVDANFSEVVNDVNNNGAHNGVNNDITALTGLTTPLTPVQGGTTIYYGAGGGTANAQTVASTIPTGFVLTAGYSIYWVPSVGNTAAFTLNVNGTGAVSVKVQTESGLQNTIGGEVIISQLAKATYDGNFWVLDLDVMSGFGTTTNLASAIPDLGTALSHTVLITGTTTITSFGSTALLARPIYLVTFLGALTLTYNAASLILPGGTNITTAFADTCIMRYFGSGNWIMMSYQRANGQPLAFNPAFIQNYISGLTLSTAGGSGTFGIAAGVATDSTNAVTMLLNSAYTKTTSSWAVGTGSGGLDTGAIANTTWYHAYLIQRPDTGVVDVLFSLSATSPTLPTNYTYYRRIGSMLTDGSAHWVKFTQVGNRFLWGTMTNDISSTTLSSTATNFATNTPLGVAVVALIRMDIGNASGAVAVLFSSLLETDQAPTASGLASLISAQAGSRTAGELQIITDTSQNIRGRSSSSATLVSGWTYGWIDLRGTA
jgi:hypothetical protein